MTLLQKILRLGRRAPFVGRTGGEGDVVRRGGVPCAAEAEVPRAVLEQIQRVGDGLGDPVRVAVRGLCGSAELRDEVLVSLSGASDWFGALMGLIDVGERANVWKAAELGEGARGGLGAVYEALKTEGNAGVMAAYLARLARKDREAYRSAAVLVDRWLGNGSPTDRKGKSLGTTAAAASPARNGGAGPRTLLEGLEALNVNQCLGDRVNDGWYAKAPKEYLFLQKTRVGPLLGWFEEAGAVMAAWEGEPAAPGKAFDIIAAKIHFRNVIAIDMPRLRAAVAVTDIDRLTTLWGSAAAQYAVTNVFGVSRENAEPEKTAPVAGREAPAEKPAATDKQAPRSPHRGRDRASQRPAPDSVTRAESRTDPADPAAVDAPPDNVVSNDPPAVPPTPAESGSPGSAAAGDAGRPDRAASQKGGDVVPTPGGPDVDVDVDVEIEGEGLPMEEAPREEAERASPEDLGDPKRDALESEEPDPSGSYGHECPSCGKTMRPSVAAGTPMFWCRCGFNVVALKGAPRPPTTCPLCGELVYRSFVKWCRGFRKRHLRAKCTGAGSQTTTEPQGLAPAGKPEAKANGLGANAPASTEVALAS